MEDVGYNVSEKEEKPEEHNILPFGRQPVAADRESGGGPVSAWGFYIGRKR